MGKIIKFPQKINYLFTENEISGVRINSSSSGHVDIMTDGRISLTDDDLFAIGKFDEKDIVQLMISYLAINHENLLNPKTVTIWKAT